MNRTIQFLSIGLLASALASTALAADPAKPASPPAPTTATAAKGPHLPAPYNQLNLTDDQKTQITAKLQEKRIAVAAWETDHGVRRAEIRQELADAHTAHDADKTKALESEAASLEKDRRAIDEKYQADIDAILTVDQHQELEGRAEYSAMVQHYNRVKLTDQQKTGIRERVMKAEPDAYGKDAKAKSDVWATVRTDIEQTVLTPSQRLLLKSAPTTHPHTK